MKPAIHRKLTEAQLERFREEAALRVRTTPYKVLAAETGMTEGSVKQLMSDLMLELKKARPYRSHRGTDRGELARMELGLQ